MISNQQYLEMLAGSLGLVILGVASTVVRVARYGWKGFRHFIGSALTSVFVAVTTGFILDYWTLPPTVVLGIVGLCSYMSGTLLDGVMWRVDREVRRAKLPGVEHEDGPSD